GLARRLDLDDLGAHVPEQAARERPGEEHAELDHPHARERTVPVRAHRLGSRRDRGLGHSAASSSRTCATSRSRPTRTCSRISGRARSASPTASASVIWRWNSADLRVWSGEYQTYDL